MGNVKGVMVEDVVDEELLSLVDDDVVVEEGTGRDAVHDAVLMDRDGDGDGEDDDDYVEEWAFFRKPFCGSFTNGTGSVGAASIRSEAFI